MNCSTTTPGGTVKSSLKVDRPTSNTARSGTSLARSTVITIVSFCECLISHAPSIPQLTVCASGVMNEPHDLDIPTWAESVQYVVNSIRASGATNYLLLPGSNYTSAQTFPTGAGPYLLNVKDPLFGTPERLIFDGGYQEYQRHACKLSPNWLTHFAFSPQVPRLRQQRYARRVCHSMPCTTYVARVFSDIALTSRTTRRSWRHLLAGSKSTAVRRS